MIPEASIKHRIAGRLRLQIESRKGDSTYFEKVESRLIEVLSYHKIAASALTGSLVIEDDALDVEKVRVAAGDHQLFSISSAVLPPRPLAKRIVDPIRGANRRIDELSGGVLDLPGIVFLFLLAFGLLELVRGNFRRPPWYTAFWYAFGIFSKTIFDELNSD